MDKPSTNVDEGLLIKVLLRVHLTEPIEIVDHDSLVALIADELHMHLGPWVVLPELVTMPK